jgi:hypothetical protein
LLGFLEPVLRPPIKLGDAQTFLAGTPLLIGQASKGTLDWHGPRQRIRLCLWLGRWRRLWEEPSGVPRCPYARVDSARHLFLPGSAATVHLPSYKDDDGDDRSDANPRYQQSKLLLS